MKVAKLTSGRRIAYDHVTEVRETHPTDPGTSVTMYRFSRSSVGVIHVCPKNKVERLEA